MKKLIFIFTFISLIGPACSQITQQVSHHLYNPMPLNPAVMGYHNALNVTLSHGQWWNSFEGTPVNRSLTVQSPIKGTALSAGLMLEQEKIGVSRSLSISMNTSYSIPLRNGKFNFGLKLGLMNQLDRWSDVNVNEVQDISFSMGDQQVWMPIAGAGAYYFNKKWYAGVSIPSFFQRSYDAGGDYRQDFRPGQFTYILHNGIILDLNDEWSVQPATLLMFQPSSPILFDFATMVNYEELFGLGGSIRPGDSWSAMLRVFAMPQLSFVYSYERFYSRVSSFDNGSHEVTVSYSLFKNSRAPDPRFF